jgi:hypothetical protein
VTTEQPESELKRLRHEQRKTRQDEVFGGLSPVEEAEYNGKAKRVHDLESKIQATAFAKSSSAESEQSCYWN